MNSLLDELSKPTWWLSVFAAGIIVNLISSYLRSKIDSTVSTTFDWWRKRSQSRNAKWHAYVSSLSDPNALQNARHIEIRERLRALSNALFSTALFIMGQIGSITIPDFSRGYVIATLCISMFLLFISFLNFMDAMKHSEAIRSALGES